MSLGLVSYGSSDEYSSDEGEANGQVSFAVIIEPQPQIVRDPEPDNNKTLNLPPPKAALNDDNERVNIHLPAPKDTVPFAVLEEVDDEFLKKKAVPTAKPPKAPVRIVLPNLSDFNEDESDKVKKPVIFDVKPKKSSLFSMLPKPKSETSFAPSTAGSKIAPAQHSNLIPHSVRNKQKITEVSKKPITKTPTSKSLIQKYSDSESEDEESGSADFFSLNSKPSLPEISANEIQLMVAQKAAKLSAALVRVEEITAPQIEPDFYPQPEDISTSNNLELDAAAMESLLGTSKAKRQKILETNIIDISMSEIVQSKEEFLRQQIQQETSYTPTGRLVGNDADEKSKKKHHISYLAHKAKANEAELQAMWSANRYSRQQTQSKYGF